MLRTFGNTAVDVDDVLSVGMGTGAGSTATVHFRSLAQSPRSSSVQIPNEDARLLISWVEKNAQRVDDKRDSR